MAALVSPSPASEWLAVLSLVFGGCCSNAWALELFVADYPNAGTLSTFAQFALISLFGLTRNLTTSQKVPTSQFNSRLGTAVRLRGIRDTLRIAVDLATPDLNPTSETFVNDLAQIVLAAAPDTRVLSIPLQDFTRSTPEDISCIPTAKSFTSPEHGNSPSPQAVVLVVYGTKVSQLQLGQHSWDVCLCLEDKRSVSVPHSTDYLMAPQQVVSERLPNMMSSLRRLRHLRLKKSTIPLKSWILQVILFFAVSLLNNLAFAYRVPMPIHIVFRSGGSVINMIIGWMTGRRYTKQQILAVVLVTAGVLLTTASVTRDREFTSSSQAHFTEYLFGVALLAGALVLSGMMGIMQDTLYAKHGRGHWQEALFYLHFLALPFVAFTWPQVIKDARYMTRVWRLKEGPRYNGSPGNMHPLPWTGVVLSQFGPQLSAAISLTLPLLFIVATQMICVLGVHRLTSHVESLTVSLVLTARKALSLCISVLIIRGERGNILLWCGAGLVFAGTFGYSMASQKRKKLE